MTHKAKMMALLGYTSEEADSIIAEMQKEIKASKMETIDFDLTFDDDGSNGSANYGVGSSSGYGSINVTGSIGGSTTGGSAGQQSSNGVLKFNPISMNSQPIMSIHTGGIEKYLIQYVIVLNDGSCLELNEEQKITPREAIGITKFLNLVQMAMVSSGAHLEFDWSVFVEELGISRHFTAGLSDYTKYKTDEEVLYVFLFDPKP